MPTIRFNRLWINHPYPKDPCDKKEFNNQCAIRMGVALERSGVDTSSFDEMYPGRRCYPGFKHSPRHILSAQEMANWMKTKTIIFGRVSVYKKGVTSVDFMGKKGILFIKNGWGATDHIDLWNGKKMKAGRPSYFSRGAVWFWELP